MRDRLRTALGVAALATWLITASTVHRCRGRHGPVVVVPRTGIYGAR